MTYEYKVAVVLGFAVALFWYAVIVGSWAAFAHGGWAAPVRFFGWPLWTSLAAWAVVSAALAFLALSLEGLD